MLWGNFAKGKEILIDHNKHLVLKSAHPSPLAGNAFFHNHHFSKANDYLEKTGQARIDFRL
jgi:uracil-DNA glycosylase